jgi:hypothetical protein
LFVTGGGIFVTKDDPKDPAHFLCRHADDAALQLVRVERYLARKVLR